MAKYTILRAVTALLALVLFTACSWVEASEFPTSNVEPTRKWTVMHEDGFTGSVDDACKLLKFTGDQCADYNRMLENGHCDLVRVPDGTVLDAMTFTRERKHFADPKVEVALEEFPSRNARVCDLGGNTWAIRFDGCNNHAVVRSWAPTPVQVAWRNKPSKETRPEFTAATQIAAYIPGQCPVGRKLLVAVYDEKALMIDGVGEYAARFRAEEGAEVSLRKKGPDASISNLFGELFHDLEKSGELEFDSTSRSLSVVVMADDGESEIFSGEVTGKEFISVPSWVESSDLINVRFVNDEEGRFNAGMISPLEAGIYIQASDLTHCVTVLSAIAGDYSKVAEDLDQLRYPSES